MQRKSVREKKYNKNKSRERHKEDMQRKTVRRNLEKDRVNKYSKIKYKERQGRYMLSGNLEKNSQRGKWG